MRSGIGRLTPIREVALDPCDPRPVARWIATVLFLLLVSSGCHKVWRANVTQPALRLTLEPEQRTSLPLRIVRGSSFALNTATQQKVYFVFVSKDRLRFHVDLIHSWDSFADPANWRVWVEDDRGRQFHPEGVNRSVAPLIAEIGGRRIATSVYRGIGGYTFYSRDLYRKDLRSLTLFIKRPGWEYRYSWSFSSEQACARASLRDPSPDPRFDSDDAALALPGFASR